jgi:hypothetical protein
MSTDNGATPASSVVKKYQPTPEELAAAESMRTRGEERRPLAKIKVGKEGGVVTVTPDHPDRGTGWLMLVNALGTTDPDFADGLISQLMNAGSQGKNVDGKGPNFMLSVIQGIAPKDEVEAMIAAQMAAVHMATMTFARRLAHVDNIPQQDAAERAFNKLARTFAVQMEALKRYRTGGSRKSRCITSRSTKAGRLSWGRCPRPRPGPGGLEIGRRPHERHARHAPVTALLRDVKADAAAVSGPRCNRLDSLPVSRGARWRGEGGT